MSYKRLKLRIKKNEGYSPTPYKDQLGFYTIGYGHLIKKKETSFFIDNYNRKYFEKIFEIDFSKSLKVYNKFFYKKTHSQNDKELLIEMLFQLGHKGVSKFTKLLFYLNKKQKFMTCLEMMDSLWYQQTPERVKNLIKNYIK